MSGSVRQRLRQECFCPARATGPVHRLLDCQLVVPSTDVVDQAMPGDHDPGAAVLLEARNRPQPRRESAVVGLDPVVGVPVAAMPGGRQQLLQHQRVVGARSVTTSLGVTLVVSMARLKHRRAALACRRGQTDTSRTCPN
jgi:hypothetical protein